jgi:tetratricopeptide (TPR) repeat protein
VTLTTCFHQQGDLDILAEAIDLYCHALDLHQPEDRPTCMSHLANALLNRFQQQADSKALAEAVKLHRQALDMCSPEHPGRSMLLHNLADTLHIAECYRMTSSDVLPEAIDLYRQALDLRPPGHPDRMSSLNGLANTLLVQFFQTRGLDVLQEAIVLFRQTMLSCPPEHPYHLFILANLGNAVRAQYQAQCLPHALEEELTLSKRGLDLCGDAHPQCVRFLFTIGDCQLLPGTSVFNFNDGIHHILEGLPDRTVSARDRLRRVIVVLPVIEKAWQFVSEQKTTCLTRHLDCDESVLHLYTSAIRLLPQAASWGSDSSGRLRELSVAETVSRNAATRAIWMQREQEAVEMLEEARGVFWSQALRLRATSLDLLPANDAERLRGLFENLEDQHTRQKFVTVADAEWHVERRRRDGQAAETLIAEIRSHPGFERFLRPPEFSTLVQSLNLPPKSFTVIIVASALGHHALVLDRAAGRANSIVLAPPEGGFFSEVVRASLPRDGGIKADLNEEDYVSRPAMLSRKAGRKPHTLQDTLLQLWTTIAKPVIDLLGMEVGSSRSHHTQD